MFIPINNPQYEFIEVKGERKWFIRLGEIATQNMDLNAFGDLSILGYPKTGVIHQNHLQTYADMFGRFNGRFKHVSGVSPARRYGSLILNCLDNGNVEVIFQESIIAEPDLVEEMPKSGPIGRGKDLPIAIQLTPILMELLEQEGYLTYLKSKELLRHDSPYKIEISLDFYIDRAGAVGFHKDSLDHTIFVGLMFNNQYAINGPEYRYDFEPDPQHLQNLDGRLPAPVLKDIISFRNSNTAPDQIYRSEIGPLGWIVFTDETINHSSPTLESRAIKGDERQLLLAALRMHTPPQRDLTVDELQIIETYINSFGDDAKIYPEDIMIHMNADLDLGLKIAAGFVVSKNQGGPGKAGMSFVQINDCKPTIKGTQVELVQTNQNVLRPICRQNLNPQPSKMTSDNKTLVRQNSDPNLTNTVRNQPQPQDTRRQFIRFWVEVLPKDRMI